MTDTDSAPQSARGADPSPDRVLAFTDGVFAIIITILVLEIRVPSEVAEKSLASAVSEVWPTLIAWIISFLITGMYWIWHRDTFSMLRRVDRDVVWVNLIFLVPVALIPFAASVLGEYDRSVVALYILGIILIAASLARTWLYVTVTSKPDLLVGPLSVRDRRFGIVVAAGPIVYYLVAMLVAGWSSTVSLIIYATVPLLYFLTISTLRRWARERDEADRYS